MAKFIVRARARIVLLRAACTRAVVLRTTTYYSRNNSSGQRSPKGRNNIRTHNLTTCGISDLEGEYWVYKKVEPIRGKLGNFLSVHGRAT